MQLFPHQDKALNDTEGFNNVGYFLYMGLGKTLVGSEKMMQLGKDTNILICQKSKIDDWKQHFQDYYPKVDVYDLTNRKQLDDFISHDTAWAGYHGSSTTVGIINYDLVFRRPELLQIANFTLMLDESSVITNSTAKITKFIHKMHPSNCILLSGTPTNDIQKKKEKKNDSIYFVLSFVFTCMCFLLRMVCKRRHRAVQERTRAKRTSKGTQTGIHT